VHGRQQLDAAASSRTVSCVGAGNGAVGTNWTTTSSSQPSMAWLGMPRASPRPDISASAAGSRSGVTRYVAWQRWQHSELPGGRLLASST